MTGRTAPGGGPAGETSVAAARRLVASVLGRRWLLDDLGDHELLGVAGVSSGEMLRVALAVEDAIGRALSDEELSTIGSLCSIAAVLEGAR